MRFHRRVRPLTGFSLVAFTIAAVLSLSAAAVASAGSTGLSLASSAPVGKGNGGLSLSSGSPVPVLAYYYIWFDPGSWSRAKVDYPQLGRYSSDDVNVMRQHVRWAKAAGIRGFIVSWKSTPTLDARLDALVSIAEAEDFKLVIIYEGLDFNRNPLPASQIDADIGSFVSRYANRAPFDLFEKPVVVWSGIWQYSREDVQKISQHWRNQVLLLATEKNVQGYQRVADLVDGNAYYWSSVNPETNGGYQDKLDAMSKVIHDNHGLWIAPAAPGFDARLVGGTTVVDRKDGATFRKQMDNALNSSPDAVGIISWNEFSENTYIEPSRKYGDLYLQVLADMTGAPAPQIGDFDSSEPSDTLPSLGLDRVAAIGGVLLLALTSLLLIIRRQMAG